ncbi:hypothetical protein ES703_123825 [subsurface metagenome]
MMTKVLRHFVHTVTPGTLAGANEAADAFTATRRLRIRGWKFCIGAGFWRPTALADVGEVIAEVSRANARNTNFILDRAEYQMIHKTDLAVADVVGMAVTGHSLMERHLARAQSDELGLLLDYGESVWALSCAYNTQPDGIQAVLSGFFEYEEMT